MRDFLLLLMLILSGLRMAAQTCSGSVGDNIFPDGDFGKGTANIVQTDPNLAPGYRYQFSPPPNDGFYNISNNTTSWGSFAAADWINIGDNSGDPSGYMMVVNASYAPSLFYEKTVTVCGNTNYEFSADIIALNDPARGLNFIAPNISFLINGVEKFSSGNVPIDAKWHTYGFTFTTEPAATEIKLAVRNNAPGGFGNDLALDNISFRPCGPNVVLIDSASFCTSNREITINSAVIGSAFATPVFQWQQSADSIGNWMDIPGETRPDLPLSQPQDGLYFRLTVASSQPNLAQSTCRIASNPTRVTYQPNRDTVINIICKGDTIRIDNKPFFQESNVNITTKAVNGCDSVTTFFVKVEDLSNFMIQGESFLCKGEMANLNAGDFAKYSWTTGVVDSVINISNPGVYGVTVTSVNNCIGQDTILVNNSEITDFATELVSPLCANSQDGQIQILEVKGDALPYLYKIDNLPFQNDASLNNLPGGTHTVSVQNALGCVLEKVVNLTAPEPFVIELGESQNLELGDSISLGATSNYLIVKYLWEPAERLNCTDCANPSAIPLQTTRFKLTATNENGCMATDSLQFLVQRVTHFYAPNAFSPNGDGVNDIFTFFTGKSVNKIVTAQIFDRWGNLLFTATDADKITWNGTFKGILMSQGVYIWTATVEYIDGSVERFSGDVMLVK